VLAIAGLGDSIIAGLGDSIIAGLGDGLDSIIAGLGDSIIAGLGDGVAAALVQAPAAKATTIPAAVSRVRRERVCQFMLAVLLSF
jgi:lysophospholipase L1-like esterase